MSDRRDFPELMDYLVRIERLGVSRRRFLGIVAGATAAGPLLAACGGDQEEAGDRRAAASRTAAGTLVVAAPGSPATLDPEFDVNIQTTDAIGMLYDALTKFAVIEDPENPNVRREDVSITDGEWNVEGALAESWEIQDGGRKAVYTLRQGVVSNWGNQLTAQDVKWSWDRRFALGALGGFYTGTLQLESPDQVQVEGEYTVSFQTDNPQPLWIPIMPNLYIPVFDSTKLQEIHEGGDAWGTEFLKNSSAGFGPYVISELNRGQQTVFEAREDYYGDAPAMKTVVYRDVPNSAQRMALLRGGDVDVAQYLRPRELQQLEEVDGVRVDSVQGTQQTWIELNAKMEPFNDVRVRKAMNFAFPFKEVLETVYYGFGRPLGTGIPTIYPYATEEFFEYELDLEQARQLLDEAGVSNFSTTLSYNAGVPEQEEIATLYQTRLREIGVEIRLNKLPAGTFYDFVSKRSEPMIFYTDAPWCPDPGYSNYLYFHKDSFVNYSNYENEEVSRMIDAGLQTIDEPERERLYTEVQKIYMTEAPWVFIVRPDPALAMRDNVSGWIYYTSNNVRFQDFTKA
jgi:peptide/nickel transport system substrate-binding protein